MNENVYLVIMAGGVGSRFWPYSRTDHPKQFIDVLNTGKSLLQMTTERFQSICPPENIFIVTNDQYEPLVKEQLPQLQDDQILTEPIRRNTAPCIAYATWKIKERNPNAVMIVAPSDHAIFDETKFRNVVTKAVKAAEGGDKLLTIGIQPNRPETGYGYIQFFEDHQEDINKVKTFTEKPQLELARKFLDSGDFLWNAGIFIWHVDAITEAFQKQLPEQAEIFSEGSDYYYTDKEEAFIKKAYSQCKNISIDYAVMEKADNVFVLKGDFGWSDLGSWNSLHDLRDKDEYGNVVDGNALIMESTDCMVKGSSDKLLVVQGLQGFLVAQCDDVTLICHKDDEARFREFVAEVKNKKGEKYL